MLQQEFHVTGIQHRTQKWKNMLIMKETLWKNNLNFAKDVTMLYVNFIATVIILSEKKYESLVYCPS
jgi:hypothetical protein